MTKRSTPETSIIIRAFNEEAYLSDLLTAISNQDYRDYEVLVVDSGSFDRTPQIAQEHQARLIKIDSSDFTFGFSLNEGIRHALGRFIVIVSAHTCPVSSDWLRRLVSHLKKKNVGMAYGRQVGVEISKYSELQDFKRTYGDFPLELSNGSYFANNANSAIRRTLWQKHPFDESLAGLEDLEWARYWAKRGYTVIYDPEAAIRHIHNETWPQVYRRFFREAVAAHIIGLKRLTHIIPEFVSEAGLLCKDIIASIRERQFLRVVGQIALYRFLRAVAAVNGIIRGRFVIGDSEKRRELYFSRRSRAVVLHEPGKARLEEVVTPRPSPGEVLIKVAYEGVCGTDLEILHGRLGYYSEGMANYPIIPGHELSGWVTMVGSNVRGLNEGDRVVVECIQSCGKCEHCNNANWIACEARKEVGVMKLNGGYADFIVSPAKFVHKIPKQLDLKRAALCEPLAVVIKGVRRLESFIDSQNGQSEGCYAVIGAGPIGHFTAQFLAYRNKEVLVYDRNPRRLQYFAHPNILGTNRIEDVLTQKVFVEATGDPGLLEDLLLKSPAGATFLLLGLPYYSREFNFEKIVAFDKTVIGSVGSSAVDFEEALSVLPSLNTEPFLQKVVPLSEFESAWQSFGQTEHLKTLLAVYPETSSNGAKQP